MGLDWRNLLRSAFTVWESPSGAGLSIFECRVWRLWFPVPRYELRITDPDSGFSYFFLVSDIWGLASGLCPPSSEPRSPTPASALHQLRLSVMCFIQNMVCRFGFKWYTQCTMDVYLLVMEMNHAAAVRFRERACGMQAEILEALSIHIPLIDKEGRHGRVHEGIP